MCLLQQWAFNLQQKKDTPDPFPDITSLIASAKALVTHVKQSNYRLNLLTKLKQEVPTRWDTIYDMLESISKNYAVLEQEPRLEVYMADIIPGLLAELIKLLYPLKDMRMTLCADKNPTIHLVVMTYHDIKKLMKFGKRDSVSIQMLKLRFLRQLNLRFPLSVYHLMATFLTPGYRSFGKEHIDKPQVDKARELLESYMDEIPESDVDTDDEFGESTTLDPVSQAKQSKNPFDIYKEKPATKPNVSKSEISDYEEMSFTQDEIDLCPIQFWLSNQKRFPKLSSVALWLLSCPATNNSSERCFSSTKNTITPHRNLLLPETVDSLIFVGSNRDLL